MHEEALKPKTKNLFPLLGRLKNFYLVGGTALALQIGHRVSVVFDMFSSKELPPRLLQQVKGVFADSRVTVTYRAPEQLNVVVDDVKCTFFLFEYPLIDKLKRYQGVPLASVREIAAMKAFAIGKRLLYKDYVDWYFLLQKGYVTLSEVIKLAQKKFGSDFSDRLFLSQLASIADVSTQDIDFLYDEIDRATIEKFLKDQVRKYATFQD